MTKQRFSILLQNLIDFATDQTEEDADDLGLDTDWQEARTRTFGEIGILTTDAGLHVKLADGSQFYLTIQEAN